MSNEALEKLLLVLAGTLTGWLLSTLTSALKDFQVKRRERRKIFSRLWMALEKIFIHLEVAPVARDAGLIDTVSGLLDIDESWRRRIPPAPPSLPGDFDDIVERVAEWESERGENWITKQLEGLRHNIRMLNQLHAGLGVQAKEGEEFISERGLSAYNGLLSDLKESTNIILKRVSKLRLSNLQRVKRKLKGAFRRKPSTKNAMQPTAK
jgi:hypothetical protein